jgi:hypothetical protein
MLALHTFFPTPDQLYIPFWLVQTRQAPYDAILLAQLFCTSNLFATLTTNSTHVHANRSRAQWPLPANGASSIVQTTERLITAR